MRELYSFLYQQHAAYAVGVAPQRLQVLRLGFFSVLICNANIILRKAHTHTHTHTHVQVTYMQNASYLMQI